MRDKDRLFVHASVSTSPLDLTPCRIVVTGGRGFLGEVLCRRLRERGCEQVTPLGRSNYDLTREHEVERMYDELEPEIVFHLAAEVGGIGANMEHPGRFFFANMSMALHLIEYARLAKIEQFVQVGSVCAYPKFTPVPFKENDLWDGYPEETNAPYGIAKKAALVMLDAYHRQYGLKSTYVLPVNLYGPNDNFDPRSSHVISALVRKFIDAVEEGAREVECWGTGKVSREFLYVEDAAEGVIRAAETLHEPIPVNLGTGREITIRELAEHVARLAGFEGELRWNTNKPDGQARRSLDTSRAKNLLNWQAETPFEEGLRNTIEWWREVGRVQGASQSVPSASS